MSHQDQKLKLHADCLKAAIQFLLGSLSFASIQFRLDCSWGARQLVAAALVWAWSDELNLLDRFQAARRIIEFLLPSQQEFGSSYQGFIKLLGKWTSPLIAILQLSFRQRMQTSLPQNWLVDGLAIFGVDGSRIQLPRTKSHELTYGLQRRKRKRRKPSGRGHGHQGSGPQIWLTTLWHMGTGLPWNWRIGPAGSSERQHWLEMLSSLPPQALIAGDAGFVGYFYAKAMLDSGHELLLRVGSNVHLLRELGYVKRRSDLVYVWPGKAAKLGLAPLVFRLLEVHGGKHPVYLISSVLDRQRLTTRQLVEIYRRRWGIEVFYRHLKQTFQRRKLRSACAANARVELEWSLAGLWAMGLYAQIILQNRDVQPQKISVAKVLQAFRRMLRDYRHPREPSRTLRALVQRAVTDNYIRQDKTSRNYPRKKQEQHAGRPKIIYATPAQIRLAKLIRQEKQKGLSA